MKRFHLEVYTPERLFYEGEVESVAVTAPDGGITVLAGHAPMVTSMVSSTLKIRENGVEKKAFHSEGFMEVLGNNTVQIFAQACEWPGEIDEERAAAAEKYALEEMRRGEYRLEKYSRLSLDRARQRLRVKKENEES